MELLTVRDVAARLKISPRQVFKLRASGQLPEAVRLARSVRWRAEDLALWVQLGCPSREQFEAEKVRAGR